MAALVWIMGSTLIVSLISLIGLLTLTIRESSLNRMLLVLVGFAAGSLMGGAFLHLLPESLSKTSAGTVFLFVLMGFSAFFLTERFLHWRHCHKGECDVHTFTHMSLVGDGIHNFIDGATIAISFAVSIHFGIITTIAIVIHEVPQEIGDFAILIHGGFKRSKALLYNFLSALVAVIGALFGFFLSNSAAGAIPFILPFAAGGFIYVAASDLVPELHKEPDIKKSLGSFAFFITGIVFMWAAKVFFEY